MIKYSVPLRVYVSPEMMKQIIKASHKTKMPISTMVRVCLDKYLKEVLSIEKI